MDRRIIVIGLVTAMLTGLVAACAMADLEPKHSQPQLTQAEINQTTVAKGIQATIDAIEATRDHPTLEARRATQAVQSTRFAHAAVEQRTRQARQNATATVERQTRRARQTVSATKPPQQDVSMVRACKTTWEYILYVAEGYEIDGFTPEAAQDTAIVMVSEIYGVSLAALADCLDVLKLAGYDVNDLEPRNR